MHFGNFSSLTSVRKNYFHIFSGLSIFILHRFLNFKITQYIIHNIRRTLKLFQIPTRGKHTNTVYIIFQILIQMKNK